MARTKITTKERTERAEKRVRNAASRMVSHILRYESDTFSASGSSITRAEALLVVAKRIDRATDKLDGVVIRDCLSDVRGE